MLDWIGDCLIPLAIAMNHEDYPLIQWVFLPGVCPQQTIGILVVVLHPISSISVHLWHMLGGTV